MGILKKQLSHIRQYKLSALLNVIGLAIAFVVAYSVLPNVYDTYTFNNEIKNSERVFRLETRLFHVQKVWTAQFFSGLARDFLKKSPLVESYYLDQLNFITEVSLDGRDCTSLNRMRMIGAERGLKQTLGVEIISGSWEALFDRTMNNVAICSSAATKLNLAVGNTIYVKDSSDDLQLCNIVAIYEDMPKNSDFDFELIYNGYSGNGKHDAIPYVKLYDKDECDKLILALMEYMRSLAGFEDSELLGMLNSENVHSYIRLTPLSKSIFVDDLYFYAGRSFDKTYICFAISVVSFLFIIAFINYINLFMALVPRRIRSANIKKVMGAGTAMLRTELIIENLFITGFAILLSIAFIYIMEQDGFSIASGYTMAEAWHIVLFISLFILSMGVICVLYPAWYITSFAPSFVLKGNFSANRQGVMLRNILLALQFVISFVLIVCAFAMYNQYYVSVSSGTGFDKENLYLFRVGDNEFFDRHNLENMRADVLCHPDVDAVTFADELFSYQDYIGRHLYRTGDELAGVYWMLNADRDFLNVMGIEIVSGRNFNEYDGNSVSIIVDEYTVMSDSIRPGDRLDDGGRNYDVVGVCKDFRYMPSSNEKRRFALRYTNDAGFTTLYVRAKEGHNRNDISLYIKEKYGKYQKNEDYEPQLKSMDDVIADSHYTTLDTALEIGAYALFAVFVSLLGVYGLICFETQYRRKEIAIRRVNGALRSDVISLFGIRFLKILLVCYAVSLPFAFLLLDLFLSQYSYKANVGVAVFIFSFILVALLTLAIVIVGAWKVVNENPIEVLSRK